MKDVSSPDENTIFNLKKLGEPRVKIFAWLVIGLAFVAVIAKFSTKLSTPTVAQASSPPLPAVTVSNPLEKYLDTRLQFLGQFRLSH